MAGERLIVRADHTLFWPAQSTLFVADVHLGKAATFRNLGNVPMPSGTTESTLGRLGAALRETGAGKLFILGDLWHAKAGRDARTVGQTLAWRADHADVQMTLVEGNHDRRSGKLPTELGIVEVKEDEPLAPFALRHYPDPSERGYVLSGHVHPAVQMTGAGKQAMRLPCFLFGKRVGILPSFGDFTGSALVRPVAGDAVFVPCEGQVISVGSKSDPAAL